MTSEIREKSGLMVDEALTRLKYYPNYRARDHIKQFFKQLSEHETDPHGRIYWPAGLLANALIAYYRNNLNLEISLVIKHALIKHFKHFIKIKHKINCPDTALSGLALIELHQISKDDRYKQALDQITENLKRHAADEEGSLLFRSGKGSNHIYAEGIGMVCPFLCKYGNIYNDPEAVSLAVKQLLNFCRNGMDSRSGLPYHGYEHKENIKHGIIGFGRALGWLMAGMVESLIYMDKEHDGYDEIKQNFRRLVDKVEAYQREDGFYPWQLPAREGPYDTSATAMILYAIARGIENDILIGIHRSRLLRGRDALIKISADGKIYNCLADSGGFGIYPQEYDYYPWALGPALSLFSVNIRDDM